MAIYKNKDIETNINERGVNLGDINVNFYTEDNGTASLRIKVKNQQGTPINFDETDMLPRLDLYAQDGSIFTNEPVVIVLADQGLIQYKVSDYVIKHEGKIDCKLFLGNGTESVHVANFYFVIKDSEITGAIGKEIKVELLEDIVYKILNEHVDKFKGEKGDTGEQGIQGERGPQGIQGEKGDTGSQGIQGVKGDKGEKGDKGDSVLAPPKIYTRDEYNQLATKDSNTLYFISEV